MPLLLLVVAALGGVLLFGAVAGSVTGSGGAGGAAVPDGSPKPTGASASGPTAQTRHVAKSIIRVFETGRPEGDYTRVAILADGAGISYGTSQGTDKGGTLDILVNRYIAAGGRHADALRPHLARLAANETATVGAARPNWLNQLVDALRLAGSDPVMQRIQDETFDELYWRPAVAKAAALGLVEPLSIAVMYDTAIQSGPAGIERTRKLFPERPPSAGGDERAWTNAYVEARHRWLSTHATAAVRASAYRMDAFRGWIRSGLWSLPTPLTVPRPRAVIL